MDIYISGALELELEAIVNCFMWVLGKQTTASVRAAGALHCWAPKKKTLN